MNNKIGSKIFQLGLNSKLIEMLKEETLIIQSMMLQLYIFLTMSEKLLLEPNFNIDKSKRRIMIN